MAEAAMNNKMSSEQKTGEDWGPGDEKTVSWSDSPDPEVKVEEEYEEVLIVEDEEHTPDNSGDTSIKAKVKKTFVFLADSKSTAFRKKLKKQFADKPMSVKRYRQEMMASRNDRRVVIYPVPIEVMSDPRLLDILEQCVQVHTQFYPIRSGVDEETELKGCLQLWFKRESDINRNMEYMWKMAGKDTKIYYDSKPGKPEYHDFYTTWNEEYQGTADIIFFVPYLPKGTTEEQLIELFPLARFIAVREEMITVDTRFRYAYMTFADKDTLDAAIRTANNNPPDDDNLKSLHLIPIENVIHLDKEESSAEVKNDSKKKKPQPTNLSSAKSQLSSTQVAKAKKTKQRVVSTKNIRYQQPRPLLSSPVRPQRWNKPNRDRSDEDVMALADLLQSLGPEAPGFVEQLANALDHSSQPQYTGRAFYPQDHEYMPQQSSYQQLRQFPMAGRGRGLLRDYTPNQQPIPQEPVMKRQGPSMGQNQALGRGRGAAGQQSRQEYKPGMSNQQQNKAQSAAAYKKKQQNKKNQSPRNQGWIPVTPPLMQKSFPMGRGRGRGLINFDESLMGNYRSNQSGFRGRQGQFNNNPRSWSPNQNYNRNGYDEDWEGEGNHYHVGESYAPEHFFDNRRLQNPSYGGGYQ